MAVKLRDLAREFSITVTKLRQLAVGSKLNLKKKETEVSEERAVALRAYLQEKLKEKDKVVPATPAPSKEKLAAGIPIPPVIQLADFAKAIGQPVTTVISQLMKNGLMINQNENIDYDTAAIVADDLNIKIRPALKAEEQVEVHLSELLQEDTGKLKPRPPVITVLGHVDHGKTTLLDKIRETNVAAGEAGGITQRISAYQITFKGQKLTFIDTPGHEAFTAMRARGARVADLAVLVVAADDGVQPQTIEALNHARAAQVPVIVALNKIDLPGVNLDKVKKELAEHDLLPEEWGGKTVCVPVSAKTGQGVPQLLEMIILATEMEELKANPDRPAVGFVIESHLDKQLGPLATVIIYTGTLHPNELVIAGEVIGKMRLIKDDQGNTLQAAPPATPAVVAGFQQTPQVGDVLEVVVNTREAKIKILRLQKEREANKLNLHHFARKIAGGETVELPLILKTDNKGSLQAIQQAISKIQAKEARVKIIHAAVGDIISSDVMMAKASKAIVLGFQVKASSTVKIQAEKENITLYFYDIIYQLIEELSKTLSGLLSAEEVEVVTGQGEVVAIFFTGKNEMTIGVNVKEGELKKGDLIRFSREQNLLGQSKITTLKRERDEVKNVAAGFDCGVKYQGTVRAKIGDQVRAFHLETRTRELTAASEASE